MPTYQNVYYQKKCGFRKGTPCMGNILTIMQPAIGSTQPPIQYVPGVLSPGVKSGRVVMLITHPLLVQRLRKRGAIPPLPPKRLSWHVAVQLYFTTKQSQKKRQYNPETHTAFTDLVKALD
jgi:hypothetical protein